MNELIFCAQEINNRHIKKFYLMIWWLAYLTPSPNPTLPQYFKSHSPSIIILRIAAVVITAIVFVGLVLFAFNKDGTYRLEYKESNYEPPLWIFSIIWSLIFVLYAWSWIYSVIAVQNALPGTQRLWKVKWIDLIFILGLIVMILGPLVIALSNKPFKFWSASVSHKLAIVVVSAFIVHQYTTSIAIFKQIRGAAYATAINFALFFCATWGLPLLSILFTSPKISNKQ